LVRGGERIQHHAHAAGLEEARQLQQRLRDLGALVLSNQRDGLEVGRHGPH
jgi:hypothetical protein